MWWKLTQLHRYSLKLPLGYLDVGQKIEKFWRILDSQLKIFTLVLGPTSLRTYDSFFRNSIKLRFKLNLMYIVCYTCVRLNETNFVCLLPYAIRPRYGSNWYDVINAHGKSPCSISCNNIRVCIIWCYYTCIIIK